MIYLYTTYFRHNSPSRQQELDECVISNIKNEYFHKVIIFTSNISTKYLLGLLTTNQKKKLTIINIENAPTYKQWIESIVEIDHIAVFSNADIYFDQSICKIYEYFSAKINNQFLCISRYEKQNQKYILHKNPKWSQDVWAIRQKDKKNINFLKDIDISTGICRCDNKFAYKFAINGWSLYNPCYYIRCYHNHQSNIRSYICDESPIVGGLTFVHPCILDYPSSLEYSIFIDQNNINNIVVCKTHTSTLAVSKLNSSSDT